MRLKLTLDRPGGARQDLLVTCDSATTVGDLASYLRDADPTARDGGGGSPAEVTLSVVDAAHKATLMSAIAFGVPVQFDRAYIEGITALQAADIRYAEQLGYRIKLLGITKRREQGFELRGHEYRAADRSYTAAAR